MADKRPGPGLTGVAASWAARAALVVGGVAVAIRFGVPAAPVPLTQTGDAPEQDNSGRGRHGTPASRAARQAGHETVDMSARVMARAVAGLFVVATTMVLAMVGFRAWSIANHQTNRPTLTAEQMAHPTPPPPNLQRDPVGELTAHDQHADALLDSYARLDGGYGRIPISRAMTLMLGRPLETPP